MCGIAGLVSASGLPNDWPDSLRALARGIRHRGPDDDGFFTDAHRGEVPSRLGDEQRNLSAARVAFAHQRLSIIDLSEAARQPLVRAEGRVFLTYNGEVYNYRELRSALESEGCRFRTQSDTEVVLEAYLKWGIGAVRRLRGIFALAIADLNRGKVFLVRDHLGVKPLYLAQRRSHWIFASELKAIASTPGFERAVDPGAIRKYLRHLWIPGAHTGLLGVMKLTPGTWFEIDLTTGATKTETYWDPIARVSNASRHERFTCEALQAELRRSVHEQLVADVPLGAFLSGGLDSSLIVGLTAERKGRRLSTYSIGYTANDLAYDVVTDDLPFARFVSDLFNTNNTEFVLSPDVAALLPTVVETLDEPLGDPAAISSYLICAAAKKTNTVMLSGVGGDELFAGYPRQRALLYGNYFRALPRTLQRGLTLLGDSLPAAGRGVAPRIGRSIQKFTENADTDPLSHYIAMETYFGDALQRTLLNREGEIARSIDPSVFEAITLCERIRCATKDPLKQAILWDLLTYLPNLNLAYTDRTSMAHAVEVRVPFLDVGLVEWALSLPVDQLVHWSRGKLHGKWLLKQTARAFLPEHIIFRNKAGFGAPVRAWLRNDLAEMRNELLGPRGLGARGWFEPRAVKNLEDEFLAGRRDYSLQLWMLLSLELWARKFLDRPS